MLIVDRFEGDWAVLEWEGQAFSVPRALVPGDAREGDCLTWRLQVDRQNSAERRRRVRSLLDRLER